jgi:hypothetical protein
MRIETRSFTTSSKKDSPISWGRMNRLGDWWTGEQVVFSRLPRLVFPHLLRHTALCTVGRYFTSGIGHSRRFGAKSHITRVLLGFMSIQSSYSGSLFDDVFDDVFWQKRGTSRLTKTVNRL